MMQAMEAKSKKRDDASRLRSDAVLLQQASCILPIIRQQRQREQRSERERPAEKSSARKIRITVSAPESAAAKRNKRAVMFAWAIRNGQIHHFVVDMLHEPVNAASVVRIQQHIPV
jgi:hypothetical protein